VQWNEYLRLRQRGFGGIGVGFGLGRRIRNFDFNPIIFSLINVIVAQILNRRRTKNLIVSNSDTASDSREIVVVGARIGRIVNLVDASRAPNVDLSELVFLRKSNCRQNNQLLFNSSIGSREKMREVGYF